MKEQWGKVKLPYRQMPSKRWDEEERDGQSSQQEVREKQRNVHSCFLWLQCYYLNVSACLSICQSRTGEIYVSSEQCVNVIFISINLNGRKACARQRERACARMCILLERKGKRNGEQKEGERKLALLSQSLCWCTWNKVNYFSDLLRKLKEIFQP